MTYSTISHASARKKAQAKGRPAHIFIFHRLVLQVPQARLILSILKSLFMSVMSIQVPQALFNSLNPFGVSKSLIIIVGKSLTVTMTARHKKKSVGKSYYPYLSHEALRIAQTHRYSNTTIPRQSVEKLITSSCVFNEISQVSCDKTKQQLPFYFSKMFRSAGHWRSPQGHVRQNSRQIYEFNINPPRVCCKKTEHLKKICVSFSQKHK